MSGAKVIALHQPGYAGLVYEASRLRDTHRWAVVGRPPGRPNVVTVVIEAKKLAPTVGDEKAFAEEIARRLSWPDTGPPEAGA